MWEQPWVGCDRLQVADKRCHVFVKRPIACELVDDEFHRVGGIGCDSRIDGGIQGTLYLLKQRDFVCHANNSCRHSFSKLALEPFGLETFQNFFATAAAQTRQGYQSGAAIDAIVQRLARLEATAGVCGTRWEARLAKECLNELVCGGRRRVAIEYEGATKGLDKDLESLQGRVE